MELYDREIYDRIVAKLGEIEAQEEVNILWCAESGSRAWGFASPDSDYDVRFIYLRRPEYYLRLEKTRDVIEWQLDDVYDISGWDVQKALRLLHNSNPTLFEWSRSPIVYKEAPEWAMLRDILPKYFLPRAGLHHYLNTAKRTCREYLHGEQVKLKKYFYMLRPLLACRWILDRETPPPMLFSELAEAMLPDALRPEVDRLLTLKMQTPELGMGEHIPALDAWLEEEIAALSEQIGTLPAQEKQDWDGLNRLFRELLGLSSI